LGPAAPSRTLVAARSPGAADAHWNLFADHAGHATGDRVRLLPRHALVTLDRPLLAHRLTDRVAHSLGPLFGHHVAHFIATGTLFGHHVTYLVAAGASAGFRDHAADFVAAGLGLRHHAADLIANGLLARLRHHTADLVAAGLSLRHHVAHLVATSALFGNHVAHLVATSLGASFRDHATDFVAAGLGLGHHVTHLVATGASAGFTHVLAAGDFLRAALRNPHTLAALPRRALARHRAARAGMIHAFAAARIPRPATRLAHLAGVAATWNLVHLGFPVAAMNLDGLCVGNRRTDVVGFLAGLGLPARFADRVFASAGFPDRLAYGVAYFAGLGFPARLTYRVGAGPGFPAWLADGICAVASFPDRLAHGVADLLGPGFPTWLAHRVGPQASFPNRLAHGVANFAGLGFPARLAHRVGAGPGFPTWLADGIANFFLARLRDVARAIDDFVVANSVVDRAVAGDALLLILHATHGFHHGVAALRPATPVVARGTAVAGRCRRLQHRHGDDGESQHSAFRSHGGDLLRN
jgi:hypothetical protein